MNRIPQEIIEEVRQRTNIVDVVGQYVQLKKSGKNYFGLCPFHEERSPSFSVVEDKQFYHCFGCGKSGNAYQFIQDVEGVTFPEAVEKVAEIGNIQLDFQFEKELSTQESQKKQTTDKLISLHEKAKELYQHILLRTKAGEEALNYLFDRGLTQEQIEDFQIGYAPSERILLKQIFQKENISSELLEHSGLMTQRDDGEFFDRFFGRIMFPIKNSQGKTVAFSGRLFDPVLLEEKRMPKYLNSPETDIFNKRQVLYNFHQARQIGRKENELILFEGFMDVIAAHGAGIKNGVASMGTSLTNEQINMLQRTVKTLLICYDGDNAGLEASYRALQSVTDYSTLEVSLLLLPEKLDPDEFIQKYGKERFTQFVRNHRESPFTFKMTYFKQDKNLDNEHDRLEYLEKMIQELLEVPSIIEREVYVKQLSEQFDISEEAIQAEILRHQKDGQEKRNQNRRPIQAIETPPVPQVQQERKKTLVEKTEQMLLYRILHERSTAAKIASIENFSFIHDEFQELYMSFLGYMLSHGQFEEAGFLDFLNQNYLRKELTEISLLNMSEESTIQEIEDYLRVLRQHQLEYTKQEKLQQQKEAARVGDKELELSLTIEIINLQKLLKD